MNFTLQNDVYCQVNASLTGLKKETSKYATIINGDSKIIEWNITDEFDFNSYPTAIMTIIITNNSTERVLSTNLKDNILTDNRLVKVFTFDGENYSSDTVSTIGIGQTKSYVIAFTENLNSQSQNINFDFTLYLADGEK